MDIVVNGTGYSVESNEDILESLEVITVYNLDNSPLAQTAVDHTTEQADVVYYAYEGDSITTVTSKLDYFDIYKGIESTAGKMINSRPYEFA